MVMLLRLGLGAGGRQTATAAAHHRGRRHIILHRVRLVKDVAQLLSLVLTPDCALAGDDVG